MHTALKSARSILILLCVVFTTPALSNQSTLLVLGDSLSAAYGVPSETAWVELLKEKLANNGYKQWQVVNASISGETTDGGARRLPGLLEKHSPDVVIIELGGNDGLRGFPPNVIESNLASMISQAKDSGALTILVGMQIPPNYGQRYTSMFADIFPKLSDQYDTELVPFFLDGVYDQEGLMQDDGIHPTVEAQPILLNNVWPVLEPILH
ncbi:Arylesterase precursor [Marinobacter nitratireducens]|uniref:Arylesterase n=1 Tax=Marinobacter nitratireducens TaxID=1137280 RepID=A0A072N590_9GAMM|nr:arylesterase [Marinobacter nitratireducens]KEF32661.1 Arylesterase precursor [Marinobacter nitratireducens]